MAAMLGKVPRDAVEDQSIAEELRKIETAEKKFSKACGPNSSHFEFTYILQPTAQLENSFLAQFTTFKMHSRYLKGNEIEELISDNKFAEAEEIDIVHLLKFKNERSLLIKIPSRLCEKNPVDNFVWSKTKKNQDGTVAFRHQPRYTKIELCSSILTTRIHTTSPVHLATFTSVMHLFEKKLDKVSKEHIKTTILPMRSITHALKIANTSGISVTRKQLANIARSIENVVYTKTGPRSKTSLAMVRELAIAYPDTLWFEHKNNNLPTDITFVLSKRTVKFFYTVAQLMINGMTG
ncbi:hypothetical protein L5515_005009 [Caenorhabditis briggsae]|uniref:Uncharacterized protein n=1 Tax=Caenorhabditis briggsae TaxID=6238 RepID=A0AAE9EJ63_CAEBR|nr:hypothetical protein L5515_005009 [Caenorhabditis briggsae]